MTAVSLSVPQPPDCVDLAVLVHTHQATVWRYVRYLGASQVEADDLVQETFLSVFRTGFVHECDTKTACFLRTAARNQLLMLRRRQRREPAAVELEAAEAVWASSVGDGPMQPYLDALATCLEHLEDKARKAIDLQYAHRESREAIAEKLGMKPAGVKTLLRRTRDTLRNCIERRLR